ncbi:MAG: methylmalonyl Co-A mutase-associated GTPase MeaB [Ignavibacteria bacterium]|nr:methylmalonyl Co-A mutase-associated GTPase MeaB [Ignavibacteria bacterium]
MTDKKKTSQDSYKPDWVPENAGQEFATKVVKGKRITGKTEKRQGAKKLRTLSVDEYVSGVLKCDRTITARTITLIESNSQEHFEKSQEVLKRLLPYSGKSLRIGISGIPGAGKSTLIETLGCDLIRKGYKLAVLTVDPSSSVSKGSILGDKVRMEKLSREENCFIRPSPSGGILGGVARKTRETITVCEAAGFDIVLIETMGVGQSEITVRSMVDFFLLVLISGGGDELQGIKRGVMEISDAVAINKADGDNLEKAKLSQTEYSLALKYIKPITRDWEPKCYLCSALTGYGVDNLWEEVKKFEKITKQSGSFEERRKAQSLEWVFTIIEENLKENFYNDKAVQKEITKITSLIQKGEILPTSAAEKLLHTYYKK